MPETRFVDFRLVGGLACLALIYPILAVILNLFQADSALTAPVNYWLWCAVGVAWILIVWLSRATRPVLTLVLTGTSGGVLIVLAVGIFQFAVDGTADLLNSPVGVLALIGLNCLGGLVCGLIAWGLQSLTGRPQP